MSDIIIYDTAPEFKGKIEDIEEAGDAGAVIHCLECDEYVEQTETTMKDVYLCQCLEDDCDCTFYQYYYKGKEDEDYDDVEARFSGHVPLITHKGFDD